MKALTFCLVGAFLFAMGMLLLFTESEGTNETAYLFPGNIKAGWKVFHEKKCLRCHSIWGEGGKGGPDLGTLAESYVSPVQLVALLWNHWPEMWGKISAQKMAAEKMTQEEMADLFAFLYFIRYTDEPGDPQKGKAILAEKSCVQCHTLKEGTKGDLTRWARYTHPILWAQSMWNHAPQMEQESKKRGVSWATFKGSEMVDLIAYVRSLNPRAEKIYLSPGDPDAGAKRFNEKGCSQCHTPRGELDLSRKKEFPTTAGQLAGMMWNHSPEMWKGMEEKGIRRPTLSSEEMTDIVAYLFSIRYFDEPGNAERGRALFAKMQCELCHTKGTKTGLSELRGKVSPIFMARTMWNHGPQMLERMRKAKIPWRRIGGKEMADLIEYLNH